MKEEKISLISKYCIIVLSGGIALYLFVKHLLLLLLPFAFAWGVALGIRPIAAFVCAKTRAPKRVVAPLLTVVALLLWVLVCFFGLSALMGELVRLLGSLAEDGRLSEAISGLTAPFGAIAALPPELSEKLTDAIYDLSIKALGGAAEGVGAFISGLPGAALAVVVAVVSSVFFAKDIESIHLGIRRILPKPLYEKAVRFKQTVISTAATYLRSYLILMVITFVIVLGGLLVLRVDYAILLSAVISLLDLLPVLGVGIVLAPFGIYQLAVGNTYLGVGLLILWGVVLVVRQFAEPRIVGRQLGVHPLLSLLLIYVGYSLFGFWGLILLPMLGALVARRLREQSDLSTDEENAAKIGEGPVAK